MTKEALIVEKTEYNMTDCDPVALTQRLHVLTTVRNNLRTHTVDQTGIIPQTQLLDAAIQWLEDALALHLPGADEVKL